jgi:hypothetical protein
MSQPIDMTEIAGAIVAALSDEQLDALARRVGARSVPPALLDRASAARYLGISTEALRRSRTVQPVYLSDCPTKPLYRVCDLDTAIATAVRKNRKGVR